MGTGIATKRMAVGVDAARGMTEHRFPFFPLWIGIIAARWQLMLTIPA